MLAKEYYSRCNEETKKFVMFYLDFVYSINEYDPKIAEDYLPYDKVDYGQLDYNSDSIVFYFLYCAIKYNAKIKDLFLKYNIVLEDYFSIPDKAQILFKDGFQYYITNNRGFSQYYTEMVFNNSNAASTLIKAYSQYDRIICMERILANVLQDMPLPGILASFKKNETSINAIISSLERIATEKEEVAEKSDSFKKRKMKPKLKVDFGEVLTDKDFSFNPLIGGERIFRNMCALLMDPEKSLIIHGKPGVGKTALIKGLAYNIQNNLAPKALMDKHIVEVSSSELIAECRYVGMVEDKMLKIIKQLLDKDVILFIDEIHTLMGLGMGENSQNDVANILKPYLGDGRIKIVGATTTKEYGTILENGAFARRFNDLEINVPTNAEVIDIMLEVIKRYKDSKGIEFFTDENIRNKVLELIVSFSNRKNPNVILQKELYNPDLALTILRLGYDFAMVDNMDVVDIHSLIEGVYSMSYFRDGAKKEFEEKALALTRSKKDIFLVK